MSRAGDDLVVRIGERGTIIRDDDEVMRTSVSGHWAVRNSREQFLDQR